jgi:hypothetical protein
MWIRRNNVLQLKRSLNLFCVLGFDAEVCCVFIEYKSDFFDWYVSAMMPEISHQGAESSAARQTIDTIHTKFKNMDIPFP